MSIKLTNFVNTNINNRISPYPSNSYDTAILFNITATSDSGESYDAELSIENDIKSASTFVESTATDFEKRFFANKGIRLNVITISGNVDSTETSLVEQVKQAIIDILDAEELVSLHQIMIGFAGTVLGPTDIYDLCKDYNYGHDMIPNPDPEDPEPLDPGREAVKKIYQKFFIAELTSANLNVFDNDTTYPPMENFVVKVGTSGISGACAAYFSKIDIYNPNDIKDYNYTIEKVVAEDIIKDNATFITCKQNNFNCNILLGSTLMDNEAVNVGGSDFAGYELINQFMLLVVNQRLTEVTIETLLSKISFSPAGVSKVLNALTNELFNFVNSGYLICDAIWTDDDLYYNHQKIIDKGTPLNNGFSITVFPLNEKVEEFGLPDIYILLADRTSIRTVTIDGEVF